MENLKNRLLDLGFGFTDDLSRISFKLKKELEYGEQVGKEGYNAHDLLESILKIELPIYNIGDCLDESDYNYINWSLSDLAFKTICKEREFLNISAIEKYCEITRTSLLNAINREQKRFGESDKLVKFLISHFGGN